MRPSQSLTYVSSLGSLFVSRFFVMPSIARSYLQQTTQKRDTQREYEPDQPPRKWAGMCFLYPLSQGALNKRKGEREREKAKLQKLNCFKEAKVESQNGRAVVLHRKRSFNCDDTARIGAERLHEELLFCERSLKGSARSLLPPISNEGGRAANSCTK